MPHYRDFSRALDVGLPERARRIYGAVSRRLGLERWFPHGLLAALTALFAVIKILQGLPPSLQFSLADVVGRGHATLARAALHGVPSAVFGAFVLILAAGLALRSRFAWAMVILMLAANLFLSVSHTAAVSGLMLGYNALLLLLLLAAYQVFSRSSLASGTLFAVTSMVAVLLYGVFGSYRLGADFNPPITDFPTALYFSVETMSTVGYGDITPRTVEARLFVVSVIVLGISVFAASLSAVLVPLINRRIARLLGAKEEGMQRSGHFIIVGDTALARNTYQALRERKQHVTFVQSSADARVEEGADLVVGDASDLEVLREAGAQHAKAVLALSDDDSANAFVVLAMRELAENVKTVAAVNRSRNLASLKRVHPDLIIAPQILGGEMLAMALSGEQLDSGDLLDRLLHFRS